VKFVKAAVDANVQRFALQLSFSAPDLVYVEITQANSSTLAEVFLQSGNGGGISDDNLTVSWTR
jgi:hypothetical protein